MPTTLKIGRREYTVEVVPSDHEPGTVDYVLRGPRGAHYRTCRNKPNPTMMFLVNCRGFGVVMDGTWFTDRAGVLEVFGQSPNPIGGR